MRGALRWLLAVFFVAAGLNHFREPGVYEGMMPPSLPWHAALIAITGACEVLGGIGIVMPSTRRAAGWGLITPSSWQYSPQTCVALLGHMPGFSFSPTVLWLRLPFQAAFIAGVAWVAVAGEPRRG